MRIIKFAVVLTIITFVAISIGCSTEKPDYKIGLGTLQDGIYKNDYFSLKVDLSGDWHPIDDETRKQMIEQSLKMHAGDDKNLKATLDASVLNSVLLFSVFKYPLGTPVPFNPSIACTAEKVGHLPGIQKGSDYLYHAKQLMEGGQIQYVFPNEIYSKTIGGIDFDVQDVEINVGNLKVNQKYYASIMKGYAVGFVTSTTTFDEEEIINQVLSSVEFN